MTPAAHRILDAADRALLRRLPALGLYVSTVKEHEARLTAEAEAAVQELETTALRMQCDELRLQLREARGEIRRMQSVYAHAPAVTQ